MSKRRGKGTPPSNEKQTFERPAKPAHRPNYPALSFARCQGGFTVEELDVKQRSDFLLKWHKRSQFTWDDLTRQDRHGLGSEKLPLRQIKPRCPTFLEDEDDVIVFRHQGNLPFAGVRAGDTFYVVWIEQRYGDLYDH